MRIIVTGASGFIGRRFLQVLSEHTVQGLCYSHLQPGLVSLDLRDRKAVHGHFTDFRPDAVIHCAARPSVDWCEQHPAEARALNYDVTVTLAEECTHHNAALAFISTDYVFDGEAGPYAETDAVNPINEYGRLKSAGEQAIRDCLDNHLIARTTNVFGYDPASKNFLMAILPRLARGEEVQVAEDQLGSPTHVADLCQGVSELLEKRCTGTFNVVGPELANRLEWAQAAARSFGLAPELVVGKTTAEIGQTAPRPLRSGLLTAKLEAALGRQLRGTEAGLQFMREEWGGSPPVHAW